MAKKTSKRFTFADAKEKIKDLEKQIVDLSDNIVDKEELETLRYQQEKYFDLLFENKELLRKLRITTLLLAVTSASAIISLLLML